VLRARHVTRGETELRAVRGPDGFDYGLGMELSEANSDDLGFRVAAVLGAGP
jgi:hypothetical protein